MPLPDSQQLVFVKAAINTFQANKKLAERAARQLSDEQMHVALDANTNSIAVIMKHVAGNLISRWTDFLTSDGEKPNRNRDDEFVDTLKDRAELFEYWDRGFARLLETLRSLNTRRHRQDGDDSRRRSFGPTGDSKITGTYLLSCRSDRTVGPCPSG